MPPTIPPMAAAGSLLLEGDSEIPAGREVEEEVELPDVFDDVSPVLFDFDEVFVFEDVAVGDPLAHDSSCEVLLEPHCHADHVGLSLCLLFVQVRRWQNGAEAGL